MIGSMLFLRSFNFANFTRLGLVVFRAESLKIIHYDQSKSECALCVYSFTMFACTNVVGPFASWSVGSVLSHAVSDSCGPERIDQARHRNLLRFTIRFVLRVPSSPVPLPNDLDKCP